MRPFRAQERLPWGRLLALSAAAFITILTEALPAALLPQMAQDLQVSQAWAGQAVTAYALGSLLAAIPLVALTRGIRRRPLLMAAVTGFVLANTVTALSCNFALLLAARLLAGMAAGLLWALLAGYATRLVEPPLRGRAIAVAMAGTPVALAIGVPAGGWVGQWAGWRSCFELASAMALLLWAWMGLSLPDFPGQARAQRTRMGAVARLPGVRAVLGVVLTYVLAHNILYTYIAPYLAHRDALPRVDIALLIFGVAALPGVWLTGWLVDDHLHRLSLASILLFAGAILVLGAGRCGPLMGATAFAMWGLAFGGAATLFQTSLTCVAGDDVDTAQAMLVTTWNTAIAGGGLVGGVLVKAWGVDAFEPAMLLLLIWAFASQWQLRESANDPGLAKAGRS